MKWIILFLISFSALGSDCSQYENDCEYYTCISEAKHCSPGHYPLNFGKRFCLRYQDRTNTFSEEGKIWISEVRRCLIREMSQFEEGLTCSQLRKRAFRSHVPCYVEAGFCNLRFRDKRMVVKTIWPSIRNVWILASGINTLHACH